MVQYLNECVKRFMNRVTAYWEIGRAIVEQEQQRQQHAEYGRGLPRELSQRPSAEFGTGFDRSNLWHIRSFYLSYPILDAVRRELSWTHYRILLRVEKPEARAFYEAEAVNTGWSTRELERQIHTISASPRAFRPHSAKQPPARHRACGRPSSAWRRLPGRWRMIHGPR
ncbi:MAG: DUF1016 domain-containing protein [Planctomycetaceae bacterium]|nr:DUF1016 domain-containing protein [Planctomycetaceae bacterium]